MYEEKGTKNLSVNRTIYSLFNFQSNDNKSKASRPNLRQHISVVEGGLLRFISLQALISHAKHKALQSV